MAERLREAGEILLSTAGNIETIAHTPDSVSIRETFVSMGSALENIAANLFDAGVLGQELLSISLELEELAEGFDGDISGLALLEDPTLVEAADQAGQALSQVASSVSSAAQTPTLGALSGLFTQVGEAFADAGGVLQEAANGFITLGVLPWTDDCTCGATRWVPVGLVVLGDAKAWDWQVCRQRLGIGQVCTVCVWVSTFVQQHRGEGAPEPTADPDVPT